MCRFMALTKTKSHHQVLNHKQDMIDELTRIQNYWYIDDDVDAYYDHDTWHKYQQWWWEWESDQQRQMKINEILDVNKDLIGAI